MCGIVGAIANRNIVSTLIEGLSRLEYRGYDSAGVAVLNQSSIERVRAVGRVSAMTEKDRSDLDASLHVGVDWIAVSFVQRPDDIAEVKKIVRGRASVLAKIEKPQAIARLDEIMELSDALMVARGDLVVADLLVEVVARDRGELDHVLHQRRVVLAKLLEHVADDLAFGGGIRPPLFEHDREAFEHRFVHDGRVGILAVITATLRVGRGHDVEARCGVDVAPDLLEIERLAFQHRLETHERRTTEVHFVEVDDGATEHRQRNRTQRELGLAVHEAEPPEEVVFVGLAGDVDADVLATEVRTDLFAHVRLTVAGRTDNHRRQEVLRLDQRLQVGEVTPRHVGLSDLRDIGNVVGRAEQHIDAERLADRRLNVGISLVITHERRDIDLRRLCQVHRHRDRLRHTRLGLTDHRRTRLATPLARLTVAETERLAFRDRRDTELPTRIGIRLELRTVRKPTRKRETERRRRFGSILTRDDGIPAMHSGRTGRQGRQERRGDGDINVRHIRIFSQNPRQKSNSMSP